MAGRDALGDDVRIIIFLSSHPFISFAHSDSTWPFLLEGGFGPAVAIEAYKSLLALQSLLAAYSHHSRPLSPHV